MLCTGLLALLPGTAAAELIFTTNGSTITRFDSALLGTTTTVPLVGLQAGETSVGLDARPANQGSRTGSAAPAASTRSTR